MASGLEAEIGLADRLFGDLRAQTGDAPGVTRASYGPGERYAHARMTELARELALETATDVAGNLYMTLPGRDRAAPRIMIGSHLDSVPHGGNYDGAAGVVAGMAALARLRAARWTPRQDITVMGIRAEEMSWFPAHYIGSRAAFGLLPVELLDGCVRFDSGRTLADHMARGGLRSRGAARRRRASDGRRHPLLSRAAYRAGPDAGGARRAGRHRLGDLGQSALQALPRDRRVFPCRRRAAAYRHDAVLAATEFVQALERHWLERERAGTDFVCTVGQFYTDAAHHTITKIPGDVRFTMDIRSDDNDVLMATHAHLLELARTIGAARGVEIELGPYTNASPARMDKTLQGMLREQAIRLGIPAIDMASGAGHDCAVFANEGVPCAMIFLRNDHGSHNPHEAMAIDDFGAGLRLLVALLEALG